MVRVFLILAAVLFLQSFNTYGNQGYRLQWGLAGLGTGNFSVASFPEREINDLNINPFLNMQTSIGYSFNDNYAIVTGVNLKEFSGQFYADNERHIMSGRIISIPLLIKASYHKENSSISPFTQMGFNYSRDIGITMHEPELSNDISVNNLGLSIGFGLRYNDRDDPFFFDFSMDASLDSRRDDLRMNYVSFNGKIGMFLWKAE